MRKALMFIIFFFVFSLVFVVFTYLSLSAGSISVSFSCGSLIPLEFDFLLDQLGLSFGAVVCLISSSVCLFSMFYMADEVYKDRFIWLIGLFVGSMMILLVSGNMISLMIGWDGLGLVSFLLVIYYDSKSSMAAGMITVMMNRVGDVIFIMVLGLISGMSLWPFFSLSYSGLSLLMCSMIALGSITKSAQIPFSSWLPAAMAAPTPVSTLVHSSTLVTAGLFVLIRFSDGMGIMFMGSVMGLLTFFTCLMAGGCAMFEPDLKKIVALSTLSQLGVMGMALSFCLKEVAFFHLLVHALFKALMFLCVGCIIMVGLGVQEARFFSGLVYKMPVTSMWLMVSCASLSGFPMFSGFFSKDQVLEGGLASGLSYMGAFFVSLSCFLTGYYSLRLLRSCFYGDGGVVWSMSGEGKMHVYCMSLLGLGSVVGALVFQSIFLGFNGSFCVSLMEKLSIPMSVGVGFGSLLLYSGFFVRPSYVEVSSTLPSMSYSMTSFLSKMFYLSKLSGSPLSAPAMGFGKKALELESSMDIFVGASTFSKNGGQLKYMNASEDHWGFWMMFLLYLAVLFSAIWIFHFTL